jgi:hypothetical protein
VINIDVTPGIMLSGFIQTKCVRRAMPCHSKYIVYTVHDAAILNFDRTHAISCFFFAVVACDTTGGVLVCAEY